MHGAQADDTDNLYIVAFANRVQKQDTIGFTYCKYLQIGLCFHTQPCKHCDTCSL